MLICDGNFLLLRYTLKTSRRHPWAAAHFRTHNLQTGCLAVGLSLVPPPLEVVDECFAVALLRLLRVEGRVLQVSVLGRHVCAASQTTGAGLPHIGREKTQSALVGLARLGGQIIEAET